MTVANRAVLDDLDVDDDAVSKRYQIQDSLGRGSFGEVYKATDLVTGDLVALKRIFIREPAAGVPDNVLREYKGQQLMQHDNVVALLDTYVQGQCVVLVQEYCAANVRRVVQELDHPVLPAVVKRMMLDLLQGVDAIHGAGLIHRDLKPSNLLLDEAGVLKIGDFGLCRPALPAGGQYSFSVPSRSYRAPELLFGAREYDGAAADMWSVGCIFGELLGKAPMFEAEGEIQQLAAIFGKLGSYDPREWGGAAKLPDYGKIVFPAVEGQPLAALLPDAPPSAVALLQELLRYNPGARPTAAQALRHDYFLQEPYPAEAALFAT